MYFLKHEIELFVEKHNYWAYTTYINDELCLITSSHEEYDTLYPMYSGKVQVLLKKKD